MLPSIKMLIEFFESVTVSQIGHHVGKARPILPTRIADHDFDLVVCRTMDETGDVPRMPRLI